MKYDSDEALTDELARVGRAISPRPEGLRTVLKGQASPLIIVTSYMSIYTKVGATLVAILVVVGGTYYLSVPGTSEVALTEVAMTADSDAASLKSAAVGDVPIPPADDSFEGFAAAMEADLASQEAAITKIDEDADLAAASVSSDSNSQALYDPESI